MIRRLFLLTLIELLSGCFTSELLAPPENNTYTPRNIKQVTYRSGEAQIVFDDARSEYSQPAYMIVTQKVVLAQEPAILGEAYTFSGVYCKIDDEACTAAAMKSAPASRRLTDAEKQAHVCRVNETTCIGRGIHEAPSIEISTVLPQLNGEPVALIDGSHCSPQELCPGGLVPSTTTLSETRCDFGAIWIKGASTLLVKDAFSGKCNQPYWLSISPEPQTVTEHRSLINQAGRVIGVPFAVALDVVTAPVQLIIIASIKNMHLF